MGLFGDLLDLAGSVIQAGNTIYEKAQKIEQFTQELDKMSDFEIICYYYACKAVMDKRDIVAD